MLPIYRKFEDSYRFFDDSNCFFISLERYFIDNPQFEEKNKSKDTSTNVHFFLINFWVKE